MRRTNQINDFSGRILKLISQEKFPEAIGAIIECDKICKIAETVEGNFDSISSRQQDMLKSFFQNLSIVSRERIFDRNDLLENILTCCIDTMNRLFPEFSQSWLRLVTNSIVSGDHKIKEGIITGVKKVNNSPLYSTLAANETKLDRIADTVGRQLDEHHIPNTPNCLFFTAGVVVASAIALMI